MPDLVRALAISGGILLLVAVLTVFVSMAAVNRGAANMGEAAHHREDEIPAAKETAAAAPPAKGAKAAAASDEISVIQILLFGVGLFTVTVLALLALSFLQHVR